MKQFIKKFIGEIILTGGIGFFTYNIFNFSYYLHGGEDWLDLDLGPKSANISIAYYYHNSTLIMITIGAMLITIGVLLIKNRQKKS